ncbi:MAG: CHASE2 domain-containing protein [Acidobacteria bacterium]|nr:CHASE2 domain-containing protein [Acidobacteriota bacterium]
MKKVVSQFMWPIAIIVISAVMALLVDWRAPWLGLYARDALMRARGIETAPAEIVIVAIDDDSIARFGRFPWPRSLTAQALDKITAAHPKVIGLSVLYSDATTESDDLTLAQSIKNAGNVVVAAQLTNSTQRRAEWLRPLPTIEQAAAAVGHGNILTDTDGVARSVLMREADDEGRALWSMSAEIVRVADGAQANEIHEVPNAVRIAARTIPVLTDQPNISVVSQSDNTQSEVFRASRLPIDFVGPTGSFAAHTFSFADVIDGRVGTDELRGKYVLIGATASAMSDRVASPFAKSEAPENMGGNQNGTLMPGVEVLANSVTTILRDRFYTETPDWLAALGAALIAAAIVFALSVSRERFEMLRQVMFIAGLLLTILLTSYLLFSRWLIVPPLVPALIALGAAIPLTLLRRAMTLSIHLDDRFTELIRESAKLSPLAISLNGKIETSPAGGFWPRGTNWKLRLLETLQRQLMARSLFVDRALSSIEDGLLIADAQGRIVFANPRASQILASPERPLLGDNLLARLNWTDPGSVIAEARTFSRLLKDRQTIECELTVGETQPRYFTLRMAPVVSSADSGDGNSALGIVATLADITKQRELQQMKNDVMAMVTHEMRTPLTAIKGMSEVLMQFDTDANRRREMHQTINEAAQRLSRMIDEYLDLSRLESGARQLRLTPVRLNSLVEQNLLLMEPLAAQRRIKLTRQFAEDLPGILADEDLISRALTNLLANAIKYSPTETEVVVASKTDGKSVFVSVTDQGYGIAPELQARIFEKFYRVPRVEDADAPGAGLGLAMVREIAELHAGRVMVESESGSGSTFTLRLPIKSPINKQ